MNETNIGEFEKYLKEVTNLQPYTINRYVAQIKKYYASYPILGMHDIKKYVVAEHKKRNSMAKFAMKNYLYFLNKAEFYPRLQPLKLLGRKKIIKHFNADVMVNIINNISKHEYRYVANLQLYSGARASEILSMRVENIDLNYTHNIRDQNKEEICIHALVSGKGGAERHLIFPIETKPIFLALIGTKKIGFVFLTKEYEPHSLSRKIRSLVRMYEGHIKKSCKTLDITNFNTHDLRRGYANIAIIKGSNLITIKELLGHKSVQTTTLYLHRDALETEQAINNIHNTIKEAKREINKGK